MNNSKSQGNKSHGNKGNKASKAKGFTRNHNHSKVNSNQRSDYIPPEEEVGSDVQVNATEKRYASNGGYRGNFNNIRGGRGNSRGGRGNRGNRGSRGRPRGGRGGGRGNFYQPPTEPSEPAEEKPKPVRNDVPDQVIKGNEDDISEEEIDQETLDMIEKYKQTAKKPVEKQEKVVAPEENILQAIASNSKAIQDNYEVLIPNIIEILTGSKSDDEIQMDLCDLIGFEEFETISALLSSRSEVRRIVKEAKTNITKESRTSAQKRETQGENTIGVGVGFEKVSKNKAPETNHKVLAELGFSFGMIEENSRLGLHEKKVSAVKRPQFVADRPSRSSKQHFQVESVSNYDHLEVSIKPYLPERLQIDRIPVSKLPKWVAKVFPFESFNEIQSTVFDTAVNTSENILISAPTGAGKTNIAMLTVLRSIFRQLSETFDDLESVTEEDIKNIKWNFKIVYLVPLKALANEIVSKFSALLRFLHLRVNEFSGDVSLTKEQIEDTQIFIAIPEKWDLFTRKNETIYSVVNLIIIDEIHIINEERGRVLECIIARAKDSAIKLQKKIRYVGLSATMPNYEDIAEFIEVKKGLFAFDSSYRATPLEMLFLAPTRKAVTYGDQKELENRITYDRVIKYLEMGKQVLIFVHSRNETWKFAQKLLEYAQEEGTEHLLVARRSKLFANAVNNFHNPLLKRITQYALGFHHAGLIRKDRNYVEKLFEEKNMNVLVSTSTLAWGVNLPAYAVIIKGTQYYDANKGGLTDMGILDIQQMFGRAGRPQFDTEGVGIIVSPKETAEHYIKLLQNQIPIESRLLGFLEDSLNAEISIGNIRNARDAIAWLKSTYLAVRMRVSSANPSSIDGEMMSLVNMAFEKLNNSKLIRYIKDTGNVHATQLGRIASKYYMSYTSIATFAQTLKHGMSDASFLELFVESDEFKNLKTYPEEIPELDKLKALCPVSSNNKAIILLFVYLRGHSEFKNSSLYQDTAYISDNASRVMRAMLEISIHLRLVTTTRLVLNYVKSIEKCVMPSKSPVWQFSFQSCKASSKKGVNMRDSRKEFLSERLCERVDISGLKIRNLVEEEPKMLSHQIGEGVEWIKHMKSLVKSIPYLKLNVKYKPVTRTILQIEMVIRCEFYWKKRWNGVIEPFILMVDNLNEIIHCETFNITRENTEDKEITLNFCVPYEIEPGARRAREDAIYNVGVYSDRWVDVQYMTAVYLSDIEVPFEEEISTPLLDLKPLPIEVLGNPKFVEYYKNSFSHFNPVQTQVFFSCFKSDTNILVGAPTGSGKTVIAELAILRLFKESPGQKVIYIAPMKSLAKERLKDWSKKMSVLNKKVLELTGDVTPEVADLVKSDIIITTPEKWDGISRNWFHRDYVKKVGLVVIDEIHLLGLDRGPVLEVIVSRMRYISEKTNVNVRFVGLSTALANASDVGTWLGIENGNNAPGLFNFKPAVRPCPVTVHIEGFPEKHYCPRMGTMNKPCFQAIQEKSKDKPVLIFVSSRRQTRLTAFDLIAFCANQGTQSYLRIPREEIEKIVEKVKDENLKQTLSFGIGMHHAGLNENDRNIVEDLFYRQAIQVLIATSTLAWGVNFPAHLCIIKGTEYFDANKQTYVEFPITDVLQMIGRAGRPQYDDSAVACLYVQQDKKNFYKKFLYEPFPLESVVY